MTDTVKRVIIGTGTIQTRQLFSLFSLGLVGAFAAFWTANSTLWVSPLSTHYLSGMDLSSFTGPLVSNAMYTDLMFPVTKGR
ncbi:MAG: hypothetical protein M1596_03180 [Firmicutes bacterium]|nr:hypothetical protein [Bacillota bacterium]